MLSPSACYFSALGQETKETNNVSLIWLHFIINVLLMGSATRMRQETIVSSCPLYGNSITVSSILPSECAFIYADGLAWMGRKRAHYSDQLWTPPDTPPDPEKSAVL